MLPLFASGLILAPLGSGSKGNATYVGDGRRGVLVDCGLSTLQVERRLEQLGLGDTTLEAVLITHEHSDHVAAAAILDRRLEARQGRIVPFYVTAGTLRGVAVAQRPRLVERARAGQSVQLAGLTVTPHGVPHDTPEPVAWVVECEGARGGVITDLGHAPRLVEQLLSTLDAAVVEFNHDPQLLMDGRYPWALKQRIRGRHGHLSNDQAADLIRRGASPRLKHLALGHLSEENNTPGHAVRAVEEALRDLGRTDIEVHVAAQGAPTGPFRVAARTHAVSTTSSARAPARRPRPTPTPEGALSLWDVPQ